LQEREDKSYEEPIEKAYDVGGIDYVIKPFRPKSYWQEYKEKLLCKS